MRGYTNYVNEFRTGKNIKQVTLRALQFASSDPKGPVYLVGPREVMEEEVEPVQVDMNVWGPFEVSGLPPKGKPAVFPRLKSRCERDRGSAIDSKTSLGNYVLPRQSKSRSPPSGLV